MGGAVGVTDGAVGVAFGGVGGALEESAHDVTLGVGELGCELSDLRDVRRPGVSCPGCDGRCETFDGAAPVTRIGAAADVADALEAYWPTPGWARGSPGSRRCTATSASTSQQRAPNSSSATADYNFQHVDKPALQRDGLSAFAIDGGVVHHTHSTYARGVEALMGTYQILDLAPRGRDEQRLEFRNAWWRRHDEYCTP